MLKRIILIFMLMLIPFEDLEIYGKIKESNVDKILVKYSAWNQFTPVQIGREYFEDNWKSNGRQTQTINGDSVKILITKLNSLKFKKNLRINTNELLLNSNITPDGKFLFWIGKDENDIRVQLVLYNQSGEKEIIWVGSLYTDIGKKRYKTSQELIDFITELFEPQTTLGDTTFSDENLSDEDVIDAITFNSLGLTPAAKGKLGFSSLALKSSITNVVVKGEFVSALGFGPKNISLMLNATYLPPISLLSKPINAMLRLKNHFIDTVIDKLNP